MSKRWKVGVTVVSLSARDLCRPPADATLPTMDDAGEGRIRTERRGALVTVIVDRETKRNALSRHLQDELAATFEHLADDITIGLVVLTGAGDRSFVSGGDLTKLAEVRTNMAAIEMALHARSVLDRVRRFPAPVIAALNGDALGGGAELAAACDFRVLAAHARMAFVQGRHAISTAWGGGVDLMHLVGTQRALRLLTTCQYIEHADGLAMGLYDRCATTGESLADVVDDFAEPMLEQTPRVLRTYKAMAVAARMHAQRPPVEAAELENFVAGWVHDDHWRALDEMFGDGAPGRG